MRKFIFAVLVSICFAVPAYAFEPEMVFVKAGCFEMGSLLTEEFESGIISQDEYGGQMMVHKVCLDDFYIGRYEVTQQEWVTIMGQNPSRNKGCDNCPVEFLHWKDARRFIRKLNRKTGMKYRLPTEAEWEYAARGGGRHERWAGTSDKDKLKDYAWYVDNSDKKTHPVGMKLPNGLGIYDMTGNVAEWVWDRYSSGYYKKSPTDNPKGPAFTNPLGEGRVIRGGSYFSFDWATSTYFRTSRDFHTRHYVAGIGLRLAHSADEYELLKAAAGKKRPGD